jgi:hypothetical protein
MNVVITIAAAGLINFVSTLFKVHNIKLKKNIKTFDVVLDDGISNQKLGVIINESIKKQVSNIFTNKYNLVKDDKFPDINMKFSINKYNVSKKTEKKDYSNAQLSFNLIFKTKNKKNPKILQNIERNLEIETKNENNVEEIVSKIISEYMKEFIDQYLINKK